MRAIFTAVFRHAFYRRIFSPEVSGRLNCAAEASGPPLGHDAGRVDTPRGCRATRVGGHGFGTSTSGFSGEAGGLTLRGQPKLWRCQQFDATIGSTIEVD